MEEIITICLLFILPLFFVPLGSSFFEIPKVYAAIALIDIFILGKLIKGSVTFKGKKSALFLCLVIFIQTLLDLVFLSHPYTLFGNPYRMQGILLLWHLLLFALFVTPRKISLLFAYLSLAVLGGLFVSMFIVGPNPSGRLVGFMAEPNSLAIEAVFLWPFSLMLAPFKGWRNRLIVAGSLLLTLGLLLLSASKSGIIALSLQLIFLLGLQIRKKSSLLVPGIVVLVLFCLSLSLPFFRHHSGVFENRSEIWQTAIFAGVTHPVMGEGYGNIEYALKDASSLLKNNLRYEYADSSHNLFLDYWVEGGVIGLFSLFGLLTLTLRNLIVSKRLISLVQLIGLLAGLAFNPLSVTLLVSFWWLLGNGFTILE